MLRVGRATDSLVTLSTVGHRFPSSPWLFRNVNASFRAGTVHALTGPSGSGKSTLLHLIAGWEKPVEGKIERADPISIRWVFQNPHGVKARSALDHVTLPILARGVRRREAEEEAWQYLVQVSLEHVSSLPFSALSGGEAQRLMLARSLAAKPDLLLVDEPTAQLDMATATTVNRALSDLSGGATTIIVATHDARTVESCDEHLALDGFATRASRDNRAESESP
ncbi:ABC transporter ATP-binding protein [Leucobacter sp. NPDC077196]|uniref:ABC transporter ATP-binding protein n=1 Tax=Leucobacter sp. NPDC077196 TaxID=3154959 RepID=UPI00341DA72B